MQRMRDLDAQAFSCCYEIGGLGVRGLPGNSSMWTRHRATLEFLPAAPALGVRAPGSARPREPFSSPKCCGVGPWEPVPGGISLSREPVPSHPTAQAEPALQSSHAELPGAAAGPHWPVPALTHTALTTDTSHELSAVTAPDPWALTKDWLENEHRHPQNNVFLLYT